MSVYDSTSLTTLRQRILRELDLGLLIPNGFFTSAAAGSITSTNMLRNSNWGAAEFQNRETVIFRPGAASSADFIRFAGALTNSTGLLAHTGADYADTTVGTETVELWYDGIRPDQEILDAFNRALSKCYFSTFVPISHLGDLDGDMAKSTDTDWTDVLTPTTSAKSTTARRTPFGLRSYNLINDAADEGTQSATLSSTQGLQVRLMAIASANVGTASLRPYDVTNSADFGTAVTHSEEEPQLMMGQWETSPATCKEFAARLLGTTSTSDIFWNALWVYKQGVNIVHLPTYVSEGYKVPSIFRCRPTLANPNSTNCYAAEALDMEELQEGVDYRLMFHQGDANPYAAVFANGSYFDYPLAIEVRRPWSDFGTFTAESSITQAPLNELGPRFKLELIDTVYTPRFGSDPKWASLRAIAANELSSATLARPIRSMAQKQPFFHLSARHL